MLSPLSVCAWPLVVKEKFRMENLTIIHKYKTISTTSTEQPLGSLSVPQHENLPTKGHECQPDLSDDTFRSQVKKRSVGLRWRQALQLCKAVPGSLLPGLCVGYDIVQVEDHPEGLIRAHVMPHAFCSSDLQCTTMRITTWPMQIHEARAGGHSLRPYTWPPIHEKQGSA